jgi:putative colanic acid biosynthesis glycosyltransferase
MPVTKSNTEQLLFTIVTVTKDNLEGLTATEASIKAQSVQDFEWIVIDGNSQDGTQDHLKEIGADYISEDDRGIYDAMNKGIGRAKGRYTLFLNAGDCFAHPDVLRKLRVTPTFWPDLIYGDALEQSPTKQGKHLFKAAKSHKHINRGLFTHHQSIFYKTKYLKELHYNTLYKLAADYDLTLRFLKAHPDAFYVAQPICIFESGGISQRQEKRGRIEQQIIRKKLLGYNWMNNKSIALTQGMASTIKKRMPPVYWWLRDHSPKATNKGDKAA